MPLISTVILITLFPYVTNLLLQVSLWYKKQANDKRKKIDGKVLLSIDDSIALRLEIERQNENFNKLLKDKENEIKNLSQIQEALKVEYNMQVKKLKDEINIGRTSSIKNQKKSEKNMGVSDPKLVSIKIIKSVKRKVEFDKIIEEIIGGSGNLEMLDGNAKAFFVSNLIIEQENTYGSFYFTKFGLEVVKFFEDDEK
jgi:hypothetical protein